MKTGHIICGIALVALMNCVSFVLGQEQGGFAGNKVTNLTKSDLVGVPNKQVIANIYEVPAGAMVPRHFHHGDEFHLVLAGEWAAEVEGRPIKNLKTGVKFGRKPKLTPHQQQEALERRARGDALGLTSPDPMQSHTQLSHVSRNSGPDCDLSPPVWPFHHDRTSPSWLRKEISVVLPANTGK